MPFALISAIFSGFFAVRIFKGPWMRNPQYVAIAMVGCGLGIIALSLISPELEDSFLAADISAITGAFIAMKLYDGVMNAT